VNDEDTPSIARLPRPISENLGYSGNATEGVAICEVLVKGRI